MDREVIVKKRSIDGNGDTAVQSSRSRMDELKGKLFTANGYEKQALSELFAHIDGLERRLARLEKLTNGG